MGRIMEKPIVIKKNSCQIVGMFHLPSESRTGKFPCVILCHGFTGNKSESHFIFTRLARILTSSGMACLRFDFRGSGDSSNFFEDMSLFTEMQDVDTVYRYLIRKQFIDKEKIGVLGLSMGAVSAVYLASKYPVKSICLWSPVAFTSEIEKKILTAKLKKKVEKKGKVYLAGSGFRIGKNFIDSLRMVDPQSAALNFKGHAFVIHSRDDAVINISHAVGYYKAFHNSSKSRKIMLLPKGGHTFVFEEAENLVISETKNFFLETLAT